MPGSHSLFSPSNGKRVAVCLRSLTHNANAPDRRTVFSESGTFDHEITDRCIDINKPRSEWKDPAQFVGTTHTFQQDGVHYTILFDEEHAHAVERNLDYIADLKGYRFAERRLEITPWTPSAAMLKARADLPQEVRQFGTTDHAVARPGHLDMVDYKYGKGVQVYAEKNIQLVLYALALIHDLDWAFSFKTVTLHVLQPYLDHFDTWETTVGELRELGAWIRHRFILALDKDAPYGPDPEACQFCAISGRCRAQAEAVSSHNALKFDDLSLEFENDPNILSMEELAYAWVHLRKLNQQRFEQIEQLLVPKMLGGLEVEGAKVVEGRSFRAFRSEHDATEKMSEAGIPPIKQYKRRMISPAQADKLTSKEGRKIIAEAVVKPPGNPTIVPSSDKRKPYHERHASKFDDLDSPETDEG